jgi:hypothetical protein
MIPTTTDATVAVISPSDAALQSSWDVWMQYLDAGFDESRLSIAGDPRRYHLRGLDWVESGWFEQERLAAGGNAFLESLALLSVVLVAIDGPAGRSADDLDAARKTIGRRVRCLTDDALADIFGRDRLGVLALGIAAMRMSVLEADSAKKSRSPSGSPPSSTSPSGASCASSDPG